MKTIHPVHFDRLNDRIPGFCPIQSFPDGEGIHPPRQTKKSPLPV
ncbi:MAG: hypothetical protein ACK5C0_10725 [Candidatus Kapaibacterium sp.]